MKLIADYHIHSKNSKKFKLSHSSIEEIARKANSLGLVEVAVTDHGYKHFFAADKQKLLAARQTANELSDTLGTRILLGVEADVLSEDGTLDVDEETLENIDILIIGYHKMIKTDFASYFGKQKNTKEAISAATDAFVNAILRYDVDIVAHPNADIKLDLYRLGKVCKENDVLIEINNRHANFSDGEMADLLRSGASFVVSSDAYTLGSIGKVDEALKVLEKYDIPQERVVNVAYGDQQKSDIEREIEEDEARYQNLLKEKGAFKHKIQLDSETERQLDEIAKELGLSKENDEINIDPLELLSEEEKAVVERAKEFLKKDDKNVK